MKKQVLTAAMAGLLSVSALTSAFAASTSGGGAIPTPDGTEVWAGVIMEDPDAKIKVEVPTLFAFVVNGTVGADRNQAVTVANGALLLPNVKVVVDTADGNPTNHNYSVTTDQSGNMNFVNYSTAMDGGDRVGIPVDVSGSIKNEGTDASRNYWTHVGTAPTTATGDFKKYRLSIDGEAFSAAANGGLAMANPITLAAPDVTNGNLDAATNLARVGTTHVAAFGVEVGGVRGNYTQVEQSAKVGSIVWTVSYNIVNGGTINTAPDNDYQDAAAAVTP